MYKDYDKTVSTVYEYLTKNHYSQSVIYSHLNCYRSFKKHLAEKSLHYSHEEALKWLYNNRPKWHHPKFKVSRLSLFRLNDVIKNGFIIETVEK